MATDSLKIYFRKASVNDYDQVLKWLDEPHVKEFWDNSLEHKKDILIPSVKNKVY